MKPESFSLEPKIATSSIAIQNKLWTYAPKVMQMEKAMNLDYKQQVEDKSVLIELHRKKIVIQKRSTMELINPVEVIDHELEDSQIDETNKES